MHHMAAMSSQEYYIDYKLNHMERALVAMPGVIVPVDLNLYAIKQVWVAASTCQHQGGVSLSVL